MGELVQPASECPGQVVVPFARGPQGADRSDRLDLTTSEDMMTATELSEWRSAGRGPARRQDVPDLGLGSPTPNTGCEKEESPGESRLQHEHFRFKISLVVQSLIPALVRRECGYIRLLLYLHTVPGSLLSTEQIQPQHCFLTVSEHRLM
jgi:hypothetical protein